MTIQNQQRIDLLMFAIDSRIDGTLPALLEDCTLHVVTGAGAALRLVHRHEPRLLMVWVARGFLEEAASLIDAVRRRRPELPLIALTAESNVEIERAVRVAGAGYYFALDGDPDPPLLRQTLEALGLSNARASPREKPRARGRPPAVYRSP